MANNRVLNLFFFFFNEPKLGKIFDSATERDRDNQRLLISKGGRPRSPTHCLVHGCGEFQLWYQQKQFAIQFPKIFLFLTPPWGKKKNQSNQAAKRETVSSPSPSSLGRCKFLCRRADHRHYPADSTAGQDGWCMEHSPWSLQHTNTADSSEFKYPRICRR